jgi:2-C-methyl-D-erythritol 4-phosphate cytidylyltransferase
MGAGQNKVYLPAAGRPVLAWSLAWAGQVTEVGPVVLVIRPQDAEQAAEAVAAAGLTVAANEIGTSAVPVAGLAGAVAVVPGGSSRHQSEQAALDHLAGPIVAGLIDVVVIHDGARPLAGPELLRTVIRAAALHGGAVPTVPEDRVWQLDGDGRLNRPDPEHALHRVQTPQAFRAQPLLAAYAAALRDGLEGTDTSATLEGCPGVQVMAVPGRADNLKVTFAEDLRRAERLLS